MMLPPWFRNFKKYNKRYMAGQVVIPYNKSYKILYKVGIDKTIAEWLRLPALSSVANVG